MVVKRVLQVSAVALLLAIGAEAKPGGACDSKSGACDAKPGMHHDMQGKKACRGGQMHIAKKVIAAASRSGITPTQAMEITIVMDDFKQAKRKLKASKMFPIDAITEDGFDKEAFMKMAKERFEKKTEAVSKMFMGVYEVLDDEQKAIFSREFKAPFMQKMIHDDLKRGKHYGKKGC